MYLKNNILTCLNINNYVLNSTCTFVFVYVYLFTSFPYNLCVYDQCAVYALSQINLCSIYIS